jgi:hypothetical protein
MKMVARILPILVTLAALGNAVLPAAGDEPVQSGEGLAGLVRTGEYKDLTWYRELKLGTAPYVNPGLLQSTAIVYKYDLDSTAPNAGWTVMLDLFQSGQLGVALESNSGYTVSKIDSQEFARFVEDPASRGSAFLVSAKKLEALGAKPAGELVTWDAGNPVTPEFPK